MDKPLNLALVLLMPTKHMGNLLVSLQSIVALAQSNQQQTRVVVDESYRDILESMPEINDVLYYPRKQLSDAKTFQKLSLLTSFYRSLRAGKAKLLLNFDSQNLSTTMALLSGVSRRWGLFDTPHPKIYEKTFGNSELGAHQLYHYHQHTRELLASKRPKKYPALSILNRHRKSLADILQNQISSSDQPYICIHAGATKDYKKWPAANFADTADWLANKGYRVIFIGAGKSDYSVIADVFKACSQTHIDLCDALTLGQLMALFAQCAFFLGNDSGPMHLAAASGARVIALFGPTDEHRWGPLGDNATVIRDPEPCTNTCSRKSCPENYRCIKSLRLDTVRDVLAVQLDKYITQPLSKPIAADITESPQNKTPSLPTRPPATSTALDTP